MKGEFELIWGLQYVGGDYARVTLVSYYLRCLLKFAATMLISSFWQVKEFFCAMSVFLMSQCQIAIGVLDEIDKACRNFL